MTKKGYVRGRGFDAPILAGERESISQQEVGKQGTQYRRRQVVRDVLVSAQVGACLHIHQDSMAILAWKADRLREQRKALAVTNAPC